MNSLPSLLRTFLRSRACFYASQRLSAVSFTDKKSIWSISCNREPTKIKVGSTPIITPLRSAGTYWMPYTLKYIEERVLLVLKLYDKVNPETITVESHFFDDLGLDSLDHVEVVIAMENEFDFEIPEEHHHRLMRPKDVIQYVADRYDTFE